MRREEEEGRERGREGEREREREREREYSGENKVHIRDNANSAIILSFVERLLSKVICVTSNGVLFSREINNTLSLYGGSTIEGSSVVAYSWFNTAKLIFFLLTI